MSEYLFPVRKTRRDLIAAGLLTAAGAAVGGSAWAADEKDKEKERTSAAGDSGPVFIGEGKYRYELDPKWGVLPSGMKYGFGCGLAVDGKDRIIVTSRSTNPCVAIFNAAGELLETWGKEFSEAVGFEKPEQVAQTAHGIYWSKEGNDEFLYFTENVAKGEGGGRIGARVYKTDLKGKVLFTIGNVQKESDTSVKFDFANPTDVAVAPNGDVYVVDGYGSQRVSRFDKNFRHVKTIGGKGKEHGLFNTCHGVWVSTLKAEPELYIADRANARYEVFSLDLDYKRTVSGPFVRNPCCFYQHDGCLFVPDLASLVTVIDADDKPVALLGDGKDVKDKNEFTQGKHPDKFQAPHALTLDSHGSLYVLEWVPYGRVRKFVKKPA